MPELIVYRFSINQLTAPELQVKCLSLINKRMGVMEFTVASRRRLIITCRLIKIIILLGWFSLFISVILSPWLAETTYFDYDGDVVLPNNIEKLLLMFGDLISIISPSLVMICLFKIFNLYQHGVFFSDKHSVLLREMSFWFFISSIFDILHHSYSNLLLSTIENEVIFLFQLDSDNVIMLSASLICYVLSLVMCYGLKIQDEINLTV
ncbi:DUF2975 domain-containing protein [Enterobacter bugandensis]|uniref:DUF2975 domain-containing protein n=1 Tax=Enterobacter bugandensis TaxID=881260 RepID=UPI0022DF651E|nr:DUF2975 domain-containing protein [Enterobacter bugandensis]